MNILISIILPVYNTEKYLQQAINSILTQTYTNFELIIIDDGSIDESLKIIQSFEDSRIRIIKNEINKGISYSLNKGIKLAKGKYVARMDADDIAMSNRLEKQVAFLERNPTIDLIGSSVERIDGSGKSKGFDIRDYNHKMIECLLVFTCPLYHPTIMGKKATFGILKYDTKYDGMEDWELWTRIVRDYKTANLPDVLVRYRIHENNVSKNINTKRTILKGLLQNQLQYYMNINNPQSVDIHMITCTDTILNPISGNEIKINKNWLLKLRSSNKTHAYFDDKIFEVAINLTWFNFINRTIQNRKYSTFKLLISDALNLSNKQRFYIFLNGVYYSKLNFILSFIKPIFNYLNTKRND